MSGTSEEGKDLKTAQNKGSVLKRFVSNSNIKTMVMVKHFPDEAVTALANKMGEKFLDAQKQDGQWHITYDDC